MDTQTGLIFIEGLMGSGKTTLARYLADQMQRNGRSCRHVMQSADPHPTSLSREVWQQAISPALMWNHLDDDILARRSLQKWGELVKSNISEIHVSIFEGGLFNDVFRGLFLLGLDYKRLIEYFNDLLEVIIPLRPSVIYLRPLDVEKTMQWISAVRGPRWVHGQLYWTMTSPHSCNQGYEGWDGWVALYTEYAELCDQIIQTLKIPSLTIHDPAKNRAATRHIVLDFFNLSEKTNLFQDLSRCQKILRSNIAVYLHSFY